MPMAEDITVESTARHALLVVLVKSTSSNSAWLEQARYQLDEWETNSGFWRVLLDLCFDRHLALPLDLCPEATDDTSTLQARITAVRLSGMIRFKNAIERFWRMRIVRRVAVTISAEEKDILRTMLWRVLDEPDRVVALQAIISISKIARHDFPRDWPDLFTRLQEAIVEAHGQLSLLGPEPIGTAESPDVASQRQVQSIRLLRSVDTLQRVLKELSTVRIMTGKQKMTQLANALLPTIQPMFSQYFAETFPADVFGSGSAEQVSAWSLTPTRSIQVRTSHLFLKALRWLVISDSGTLSTSTVGARASDGTTAVNLAQTFMHSTPQFLSTLREARQQYVALLRSQSGSGNAMLALLTKHLLAFGKIFLALLEPKQNKITAWPGWLEIVLWYWGQARDVGLTSAHPSFTDVDPSALSDTPSKFVVQALRLLKESLEHWNRDLPAEIGNGEFVTDVIQLLVGKFMLLNPAELEEWQGDSEAWLIGEAQKQAEFTLEIRPAAERLLIILADKAKPKYFVGRQVLALFEQCASLGNDLDAVLTRDAIYAALGRLRDYIPIVIPGWEPDPDEEPESVFDVSTTAGTRLIQELSAGLEAGANWMIVRRRITWVLDTFSDYVGAKDRIVMYEALVGLLQPLPGVTDLAVRLSAARCLGSWADAIEFDPEQFSPIFEPAVLQLVALAASDEVAEMDSVQVCTNALSMLIERMGARVAPLLPQLVSIVPQLWNQPDPEAKAKPGLLTFVSKLVKAVELSQADGEIAILLEPVHLLVRDLIRSSLAPDLVPTLGPDALSLWSRSVHSTPQMSTPLFDLLALAPSLLEKIEEAPETCRIIQESALLAPRELLEVHGLDIFRAFFTIFSDAHSPVVLAPLGTLDLILQAASAAHCPVTTWLQPLQQSNLFGVLVASLLRVRETHVVASSFTSVVARVMILLPSAQRFEALQAIAPLMDIAPTATEVSSKLLVPLQDQVSKAFEHTSSPKKRKMTAMLLSALWEAAAETPTVEDKQVALQGVCTQIGATVPLWSDVLGEIREHRGEAQEPYLAKLAAPSELGVGELEDEEENWLEDTSPGTLRLQQLAEADAVVIQTDLVQYIRYALQQAQTAFPDLVQSALNSLDPTILQVLMQDLSQW